MRRPLAHILPTAVILLCLFLPAVRAATPAGSVVGLGGQVLVDRGGQRYSLRIGDQVYTDDTFEVAAGAKLKLRMGDGTILSLAPDTTLRIDALSLDSYGQRRAASVSLGQGLLRSVTAPSGQPASFEVNTAVGTSGARSTDWFVEAASGSAQVAVLNGSVSLASRTTGRAVLIPPGFGSRVDAGRDPTPPRPVSQAEFAALIARTEGAAAAPPPYYPPGYYPAPGGIIRIPFPRGGDRGGGREPGGRGTPAPR